MLEGKKRLGKVFEQDRVKVDISTVFIPQTVETAGWQVICWDNGQLHPPRLPHGKPSSTTNPGLGKP